MADLEFEAAVAVTTYLRSDAPADRDRAVQRLRELVTFLHGAGDRARLAGAATSLAGLLAARFFASGAVADLDAAIDHGRLAVASEQAGDQFAVVRRNALMIALQTRFQLQQRVADLDEAVMIGRQAVAVAPDDPIALGNLGLNLRHRYEIGFDERDLHAAAEALSAALRAQPPDRASVMLELAGVVHLRYRSRRAPADLDRSIELAREALALAPADADRWMYLSTLGGFLHSAFRHRWREDELAEAVDLCRRAVRDAGRGDPRSWLAGHNLTLSLNSLFMRTGQRRHLDEAIAAARRAIAECPVADARRVRLFVVLADTLHQRYEITGDTAPLAEAVDARRAAVAAVPGAHPDFGVLHHNLSLSLFRWAGHQPEGEARRAVLAESVDAAAAAVAHGSGSAGDRAMFRSNLGLARASAVAPGDVAGLSAAIEQCRRAVAETPAGDDRLRHHLQNLAICLNLRYNVTGMPAQMAYLLGVGAEPDQPEAERDVTEVFDLTRRVVELLAPGHPDEAVARSNLAAAHLRTASRTADRRGEREAVAQFRAAVAAATSPVGHRLNAAWRWSQVDSRPGRYGSSLAGYTAAIGLLPLLAWHGLDRGTRAGHLAGWTGLASDAASAALLAGRPGEGVELAEGGRSVLWSQLLQRRSALHGVAAAAPHLAARMGEIRSELDRVSPAG